VRALHVTTFDIPATLIDVPVTPPAEGEVLLFIEACGLNFADLMMAKGTYQDTSILPFTLGMKVCGTVLAQGAGVKPPPIGARVAVFGGQGGLAYKGVFPAVLCRKISDVVICDVTFEFQVAYGKSHLALTRRAKLQAGETLLVLGGAGGVGLIAVEINIVMDATVIGVARDAEKMALAKAADADYVIDTNDDITETVRAFGGAEVVYDPVGGATFTAALRATKREGRVIIIGCASGEILQIPANYVLVKT
jgi:NADPH2:quinone reductase